MVTGVLGPAANVIQKGALISRSRALFLQVTTNQTSPPLVLQATKARYLRGFLSIVAFLTALEVDAKPGG
jgi:hypothetical protein